jgi:hypothetical protein
MSLKGFRSGESVYWLYDGDDGIDPNDSVIWVYGSLHRCLLVTQLLSVICLLLEICAAGRAIYIHDLVCQCFVVRQLKVILEQWRSAIEAMSVFRRHLARRTSHYPIRIATLRLSPQRFFWHMFCSAPNTKTQITLRWFSGIVSLLWKARLKVQCNQALEVI